MTKLNKTELEKLTPDQKIKKLKELAEENKKEIEEAGKIIKETESKLERDKILESVKVPETKPIDIESLFKEEEHNLENTVKTEAPATEKEDGNLYLLTQAYEEAKGMLYSDEPLTKSQLQWVDRLGERVEKAKYASTTERVAVLANATKTIVHKLKRYHSPT